MVNNRHDSPSFLESFTRKQNALSFRKSFLIRNKILEETKQALGIWMEVMSQKGMLFSSVLIRAKTV